jgi:hypothetical protein
MTGERLERVLTIRQDPPEVVALSCQVAARCWHHCWLARRSLANSPLRARLSSPAPRGGAPAQLESWASESMYQDPVRGALPCLRSG